MIISPKLLTISILCSGIILSYPNPVTILKLIICVLVGIGIWSAITRPVRRRTTKEKISDWIGQIVLSVVCSFIGKKYIPLHNDTEFLMAGFVLGLISNTLLIFYRWITSPSVIDIIKSKFKDKLK